MAGMKAKQVSAGWRQYITGDDVLRRVARNVSYLFSANAIVSLLGLLTLSVLAYALGSVGLGILALIEAYAKSVDRLVRFEPWQAAVRFGTTALEDKNDEAFSRLIKASTFFDIGGAFAAAVVAIIFAGIAGSVMGLDDTQTPMMIFYACTIFFNLSSTPTAVLRLFDKFDLIAKFSVLLALSRLLLMIAAWQLDGSLWAFLIIMALYSVLSQIVPLVYGWRELARQDYKGILRTPLRGVIAGNPGILRFVWNSNINVILRTATQRFDILIVGSILGPSITGLYQLARRAGQAAMVFGRPIQQAIYPEIARLWTRGEYIRFRRILLLLNATIFVVGAAVLLVLAWNMELLVSLFFGAEFVEAAPLMIVQGFAIVLFLAGTTLNPALLSMSKDRALVLITLCSSIAFFVALVPLLEFVGVLGASLAHVIFSIAWLGGCVAVFVRTTSAVINGAPSAQNP